MISSASANATMKQSSINAKMDERWGCTTKGKGLDSSGDLLDKIHTGVFTAPHMCSLANCVKWIEGRFTMEAVKRGL
jgi:hypothetical protein